MLLVDVKSIDQQHIINMTVVWRTLQSSCNVSAHVTKYISTQSTVTAHIRLCSQMSPVADLYGCLVRAEPKRYAGHVSLLLDNLGGRQEWKRSGKVLLPALQQYRMEDRSGMIRSSTGTGYLVLHTVDERALHLTNALACTFGQSLLDQFVDHRSICWE